MLPRMFWYVLLLAVCVAPGTPARAAEVYQVSTISSLLAGGYDGATTIGEMLRHGNFGLGTFNGVDGEMIVLDGQALVQEISDLRITFPASGPASSASPESIKAVERPGAKSGE